MSKQRLTKEEKADRVANSRCAFWGMTPSEFSAHVAEFGGSRNTKSPMARFLNRKFIATARGDAFEPSFVVWFRTWLEPKVRAPRISPPALTQESLIGALDYCEATGAFTRRVNSGRRWFAGQSVGHVDQDSGYVKVGVLGKTYWAHRLAWMYVHGEMPRDQVDHRDGNRSNNAIANLRLATQSQNSQNQRLPRAKGKTSPIGVHYRRDTRRWSAQIGVNGKQISLGCFGSEDEASAAYLAAKKIHHPFQTIAK